MTGSEAGPSFQQNVYAQTGSIVYAVMHGDIHIRNGHPVYRITPFQAQPRPIDAQTARRRPSQLLAAESQVVAFTGRERELAELARWRDAPAAGVSVLLLLHGPGGQGKTRLPDHRRSCRVLSPA